VNAFGDRRYSASAATLSVRSAGEDGFEPSIG
jgi:hypothetical protein